MMVVAQMALDWTGTDKMPSNTPPMRSRGFSQAKRLIQDYVDIGPYKGKRPEVALTTGSGKSQCGRCGLAFTSVTGFDRHQRLIDGAVVCLDPATVGLVVNDEWWSFPPDPRFAKTVPE